MLNLTNENVMVVSDTHFRHKKLCFGEAEHFDRTRNYKFTSDMDADIIAQWNKNIGDNDVVIFLGDFLMNTPVKQTEEVFYQYYNALNKGKKMYWICPGDRVLVAWVENEAVVIDIVFNASTIGSSEPGYY